MKTSTKRTKHVASGVGKILLAVAVVLAIGSSGAVPALAEKHEARARHEREWRWPRGYRPYGYGPPPVVYYSPPPAVVYSPPPPVVYAPPPAPPAINFVFPIRIH